jgi:farnesyl diphosphate synthase
MSTRPPSPDLAARLDAVAAATEAALMERLGDVSRVGELARPSRLLAAMRYAASGGKRIRPFLVVESARLFGVDERVALAVGAAFECVHCYSLVHDDLPAMDNDRVRRGRPTTHIAFDEATAILAGDALLTFAFDVLATLDVDPSIRVDLIALLARASGMSGMAGGQMLDLEAEGRFTEERSPLALPVAAIERLQSMKTGALIEASCEAGAILGRAASAERRALAAYARAIGAAFQIADDLLDTEGDAAQLGKAAAKDANRGKATLVTALGPAAARARLAALVEEARLALAPFGQQGLTLSMLAEFIAGRDR